MKITTLVLIYLTNTNNQANNVFKILLFQEDVENETITEGPSEKEVMSFITQNK